MHRTPRIRHLEYINQEIMRLEYRRDNSDDPRIKQSYQDLVDKLINLKEERKCT